MINRFPFFVSQLTVTHLIVTRQRMGGGNQNARAALGQTCCYATEHFDIQEQRLSKVKYACHLEKKEKAE